MNQKEKKNALFVEFTVLKIYCGLSNDHRNSSAQKEKPSTKHNQRVSNVIISMYEL